MRGGRTALLSGICLALSLSGTPARGKTDVVILRDGNRILGEIKEMKRGILRFSTDFARTINVEWPEIAGISSTYRFEVETIDGTLYFGSFQDGSGEVKLIVALDAGGWLPSRWIMWSE